MMCSVRLLYILRAVFRLQLFIVAVVMANNQEANDSSFSINSRSPDGRLISVIDLTTVSSDIDDINSDTVAWTQSISKAKTMKRASSMTTNRPQLGVCQIYTGPTCDLYLRNKTVFIPPHMTLNMLEERLQAAYGVIKESKDMNPNCRGYALPSLCYSVLPICRTPEKTNHQYFANKAAIEAAATKKLAIGKQIRSGGDKKFFQKKPVTSSTTIVSSPAITSPTTFITTTTTTTTTTTPLTTTEMPVFYFADGILPSVAEPFNGNMIIDATRMGDQRRRKRHLTQFPPTRNSENLRRICRSECELLENELCQKEYAIAKRHPTIGQKLPLEDCYDLPAINNDDDCSKLGIAIDVDENEKCFWSNGIGYRGTVAVTASGKPCQKWARLMKEISDFPELAGQNYCRNPGGLQVTPWCYVTNNSSMDKVIEMCDIPKCIHKMWLSIVFAFLFIAIVLPTVGAIIWTKKYRKRGMTNIQDINLPNADKNIYGNSTLNSPIEMLSLLPSQVSQVHTNHTIASGGNNNSSNATGTIDHTGAGGGGSGNNSVGGGGGGCGGTGIAGGGGIIISGNGVRSNILRVPQYTLQDVKFVEELGEGAFGKVYKGELIQSTGEKIFVAVKALKENASAKTQADFKREIELISDLKHDNIVCILGVVLKEEPLCMLFEYMAQGDLHEFLIANSPGENKSLTKQQFLYISMQICEGMEYLAGHHYVHRDLAARNCLVGDTLTVKISDFGLSRDIYSSDYYRVQSKSLLPVRWMPSESIMYGKFTTESDVWSFGVVLWEIYSYGLQPYYGFSNQEVISMVRTRQLLPCPDACPSPIYSLMVECWHEQAVRRPSFLEIGHRLKIWYQAQKRSDQVDTSCTTSNCPVSRKGSAISISNRTSNYLIPSTSNQFFRDIQFTTMNNDNEQQQFCTNHSLKRDRSDSNNINQSSIIYFNTHHSLERGKVNSLACGTNRMTSSHHIVSNGQLTQRTNDSSSSKTRSTANSNSNLSLSHTFFNSSEEYLAHRRIQFEGPLDNSNNCHSSNSTIISPTMPNNTTNRSNFNGEEEKYNTAEINNGKILNTNPYSSYANDLPFQLGPN